MTPKRKVSELGNLSEHDSAGREHYFLRGSEAGPCQQRLCKQMRPACKGDDSHQGLCFMVLYQIKFSSTQLRELLDYFFNRLMRGKRYSKHLYSISNEEFSMQERNAAYCFLIQN